MELGVDLDIGQYVASGVVAFDLHRRTIKWSQVRGDVVHWGRAGRRSNAACGVAAAAAIPAPPSSQHTRMVFLPCVVEHLRTP